MKQHQSFALATVINNMVTENNVILDLGSMSTGSTGVFLNRKCTCYVEDLNEYLDELDSSGDPIEQLTQHLLDKPATLKFDFVLCWDILNYLPPDVLQHLMNCLSPHFKEGTILHTMRYVGQTMPDKPGSFRILDDFNFQMNSESETRVPTNPLSTMDLLKRMGSFTMRKTMMNQEGMQNDVTEHLLEYGKAAFGKNLKRNTQAEQKLYTSHGATYNAIKMPGLNNSLQHIKTQPNNTVLVAGKKSGHSLSVLNSIAENLFIEDVFSIMNWRRKVAANGELFISENTLKFSADVSFDLVLLWDLFNFFETHQAELLIQRLERHLKPGTLVHCLLFKSDGRPEIPAQFVLNNDYSVMVKGDVNGEQQRHISTTAQLSKLMPQFIIRNSHFGYLDTENHYFEFLFEYKGT